MQDARIEQLTPVLSEILKYSLVSNTVLGGSLTLLEGLLQGGSGAGVVTVLVVLAVVTAAMDSFGCRISYRNSGIMGTETEKATYRSEIFVRIKIPDVMLGIVWK
jgi:hypothetical protein